MSGSGLPRVLFVLGGPGSGKGPLCGTLSKPFSMQHISVGALLRSEIESGSELGRRLEADVSSGKVVGPEETFELLSAAIAKGQHSAYLIDGFPRNIANAEFWRKEAQGKFETVGVLFLRCSEETMLRRILGRAVGGRSDDNEEVFRNRVRVFEGETIPAVEALRRLGVEILEISSEGSPEACLAEALQKLDGIGFRALKDKGNLLYARNKIDPFLKPLVAYLVHKRHQNVLEGIREWLATEGIEINRKIKIEKS